MSKYLEKVKVLDDVNWAFPEPQKTLVTDFINNQPEIDARDFQNDAVVVFADKLKEVISLLEPHLDADSEAVSVETAEYYLNWVLNNTVMQTIDYLVQEFVKNNER